MNPLSAKIYQKPNNKTTILQIGEGNFLRAFFDFAVNQMNQQKLTNHGIAVANSFPIKTVDLNTQDGLYTVIESPKSTVVDCIQEHFCITNNFEYFKETAQNLDINVIVSNTTEAGITYVSDSKTSPKSYPARIAFWLNERFTTLQEKGKNTPVFILPCELIENNGSSLKQYILQHAEEWNYTKECIAWIESCYFYNTLVDRIVPGYPKNFIDEFQKEWGYVDKYAVLTEAFFLFAIQGNTDELDKVLPFSQIPLDVIYTDDLAFYRNRKVAVLNGAHTLLANLALLMGETFVADTMSDTNLREYLNRYLYTDVFEFLKGDDSTKEYIESIFTRFENTYLEHRWDTISLNSLAKFNTRNMPTVLATNSRYGLFALAALWVRYAQEERNDSEYHIFKDILNKGEDTLVHNLLENKTLYPFDIPKQWEAILEYFYKQISEDPKKALLDLIEEGK